MQVLGVFGANRPGCGNLEASIDEGFCQDIPCAGVFVVELYRHYAVISQDAVIFAKGECHFRFVVLVGEFVGGYPHVAEAGGVGDGFSVFVGEFG